MNAIILGSKSAIATSIMGRLVADGWSIDTWSRENGRDYPRSRFDLCIIALGKIAPVGLWYDNDPTDWTETVLSNLVAPVRLLRAIWPQHNHNAAVCFMAGSNPNTIMDGYSAYNASKMGLLKVVEQLDHETPDARMFALGPGIVMTKIHRATLDAKWDNPKLKAFMDKNDVQAQAAHMARIYDCLMWAIKQEKRVIGGRNICVSDKWEDDNLRRALQADDELFKLRRVEW